MSDYYDTAQDMADRLIAKGIVQLDDQRPHIVLQTLDGNAHCFPVTLIENLIEERVRIEDVDDWRVILRSVLKEWLDRLKEYNA